MNCARLSQDLQPAADSTFRSLLSTNMCSHTIPSRLRQGQWTPEWGLYRELAPVQSKSSPVLKDVFLLPRREGYQDEPCDAGTSGLVSHSHSFRWIMVKEQGRGQRHRGMRYTMERKLFYLFKKSLVSWKGRKYKSQCESKKTSLICTKHY